MAERNKLCPVTLLENKRTQSFLRFTLLATCTFNTGGGRVAHVVPPCPVTRLGVKKNPFLVRNWLPLGIGRHNILV